MSRFVLAWLCFFRILFGKKLPMDAVQFLPEGATPPKELPEKTGVSPKVADKATTAADKAADKAAADKAAADKAADKAAEKIAEQRADREKAKLATAQHHRDGALALLALLQREGRLVDFLRESLDGFSDADIGAAARDVHRGCKKVLDQHLTFEPVMPGAEEEKVSVPKGFDPAEIRRSAARFAITAGAW
jgi:hypothetical protein